MREPLVPTLDRLPESVRRFELPTPFPVGPVNCYLLLDDPVTVVDPGMLYADSVATLTAELAKVGLDAADVGAVVVTHAHPDHYGTAGWLAERAGAPIYAGRAEVPKLLENRDRDQLYTLIRSFGIPEEMLGVFPAFYGAVREWLHDIDESRVIAVDDGDELRLGGRTLQALVTPGHAAGHLSLYQLTIEPGTRFFTLHARGELVLPPDEVQGELYEMTQDILGAAGLPAVPVGL